mgnify:CR=1 FL=1
MEMWFSELHTSNVKLSMRIEKQLFSGNSDCQRIDVLESVEFGKFLALDGDILFSEKDEFIYDEMVTHVPMAVHPDVRHVLIIGGGDGGVAKELTQYDSIEKIDVVEPDEMLVEVCRDLLYSEILFPLKMARVQRWPFKIVCRTNQRSVTSCRVGWPFSKATALSSTPRTMLSTSSWV